MHISSYHLTISSIRSAHRNRRKRRFLVNNLSFFCAIVFFTIHCISILDWGTGAKLTQCQNKSAKSSNTRITSLEWINAHDLSMVMTGSDDGSVKLWNPNIWKHRETNLVSAWQAFTDISSSFKTGHNGEF